MNRGPRGVLSLLQQPEDFEMSDFRARLFTERNELIEKIEKLKTFILGDLFEKLPEIDRKDLKEQLTAMEAYSTVLERRVSRQCNDA